MTGKFMLPGAEDRTTVIGKTGTGKTVFGAWLLSKQNFQARPWVAIDFKGEELWDLVGDPPMRDLKLGRQPNKNGLYRLSVRPGQEDELESWLWSIWERGNVGLFCDEASLIPRQAAFKAILRQGRSKRIPVISCTQRPVDCDREIFSEAQYMAVFRVNDARDYKIIQGFTDNAPIDKPLPPYHSYWLDLRKSETRILKPVPKSDIIAARLKNDVPYSWFLGF